MITKSVIYKSAEGLEEHIGSTNIISIDEIKFDTSKTLRGLFYWNDGCLSDLEIRSFVSVKDVETYLKTQDGTEHLHFAYYDIIKDARITQTVIGESLQAEESPSTTAGKKKVKKEKEADTRSFVPTL